ncbi:hypothetical protein Tco_1535174, partial [Tanacetum coccineum]
PIQIGLSTDEMAKRSFEESTLYIPEDYCPRKGKGDFRIRDNK